MFDFGSPNAFLSHEAIPAIETRIGAKFDYVPILLGGIFKATNNKSPAESLAGVKNKREFHAIETQRFVKRFQVQPFVWNPFFPVNTLNLMRAAVAAQLEACSKPMSRRRFITCGGSRRRWTIRKSRRRRSLRPASTAQNCSRVRRSRRSRRS